jgi:hypothetical protein
MQGQRTEKRRSVWKLGHWGLGCLLLVFVCNVPQALAQFNSKGARSTIAGSVLIDGQAQPAAKVRVDVKALTGGELATTFTDATGRFEAPAEGTGSVIVAVQEQGYEPVEQRVDVGFAGRAPGVVITLHKLRTNPVDRQGYTVSVHSLKVPAKARRAFEKGVERLQKKDLEGSLKPFAEATNAFPDYYEAYYKIGLANLELRRDDEAEQALQKAIDLSGGRYAEAQFALGALLCERQAYPEAEEVLRRGIERRQLLERASVSGPGAFWSRPAGGGGEERTGSLVAAFGHTVGPHLASQHSYTPARIRIGDKRLRYFPEHAANWPLERPGTHSAGCGGACCLDVGPHRLASTIRVLAIPELS